PLYPLFPYTTLFRSPPGGVGEIGGLRHRLAHQAASPVHIMTGLTIRTIKSFRFHPDNDLHGRTCFVFRKGSSRCRYRDRRRRLRSEEHTSELQSLAY